MVLCRRFSALTVLALAVLGGGCGRRTESNKENAAPSTEKSTGRAESTPANTSGGIDPTVVAAWEKAGAKFGWQIPIHSDSISETPLAIKFAPDRPVKSECLPAFYFSKGALKSLQDLPVPQTPFGLELPKLPVSPAHLKDLARFRHLKSLNLLGAGIQDASLKELGALQNLETLILSANPVTDSGLKYLARLQNLKMLALGATEVRGAGLRELAGLQSLETLRLYGFHVTDEACKELAAFKRLRVLDLHLTKISNVGLAHLTQLTDLELLNVAGTRVSIAEFQKALPKCRVQS